MKLLKVLSWFVSLGWDEPGSLTARNILASAQESISDIFERLLGYQRSNYASWATLNLQTQSILDSFNIDRLEPDAPAYRLYFSQPYQSSDSFIVAFGDENVSNVIKDKSFVQFSYIASNSLDVYCHGKLE